MSNSPARLGALNVGRPLSRTPALDNGWGIRADLPYPLALHMMAAVKDSTIRALFVFGGRRSASTMMERACLRYLPTQNRWSRCSPMRYERGVGQAVVVRNLVYVLGGCSEFGIGLNRVEVYDPARDNWTILPEMPDSLHDFGAVAWRDSLIYVLGGGNWAVNSPPRDRVWLFNPATQAWDTAASLPVELGAMGCGIVGDTIYLVGGWTLTGMTNAVWQGVVNTADPRQVNWYQLETLPGQARCRPVCAVLNGILHVVGGVLKDGTVTSEALGFDPRNRTWRQLLSKPSPVANVFGAPVIGGRLYVPGGFEGATPYLARHDYLDVAHYDYDVAAESIVSPVGRVTAGMPCPIVTWFRNSGTIPDTFSVSAWVLDSVTRQLLFEGDARLELGPGQGSKADFGDFVPPAGAYMLVAAAASSANDQNPDNDTTWQRCQTALGSWPDAFGYTYCSTQEPDSIEFGWFDTAGGTVITDWAPDPDDGTSRRLLPFRFPYYGRTLSAIYVSTNGHLGTSENTSRLNRRLPSVELPDVIAPFWDDLTLRERGRVMENRTTDAVVFTWAGVPRYGVPTESLTFQVVLERSGRIWFNYLRLAADRMSSTTGIQGTDGSWYRYLQYVCDGSPANHVLTDSTTILFSSPVVGVSESLFSGSGLPFSIRIPTICTSQQLEISVSWSASNALLLTVYDASGRRIWTRQVCGTSSRSLLPTSCSLVWDLNDASGRHVPLGIYYVRILSGSETVTRKLVLLR